MAIVELKLGAGPMRQAAARYLEQHARSFEEIRIAAAGFEALGTKPKQGETWRKQIDAMRNADGSFGKEDGQARATGGAVAALLRLGGEVKDREAMLRALNAGQRSDGGYGKEGTAASDLETTYRVVRTYHMLKAQPPDVPKLRGYLAKCRNADGGYGLAPGQTSAVGPTYFAGIILHWLEAK
jgi:prenyltransferase beta subunit